VGGSYRIEMQPPEGDPFHLTGEFRALEEPARLAFTFVWEEPDPDDVETLAGPEVPASWRIHRDRTDAGSVQN
jgi:uncharacterized protein YndB with AHSA1/START domain